MKKRFLNIPLSVWVILAMGLYFIIYCEIKYSGRKNAFNVVRSDALFYHEYITIYIFDKEPILPRDKYPINRYTMGMSVTYLPAIAVGYVVTEISGADHEAGKSPIYQHMLFYLGLLYAIIGLLFTRLILKNWFDEISISIVLALIFFGTNLYYYIIAEPIMAHPASFAFVTAFVFLSLQWMKKPTLKTALLAGAALGMTTLIRPTNAVMIIIPIIYVFFHHKELFSIGKFQTKHWIQVILAGLISVAVFFPQLFYWHYYTGTWFNYSYGNEKFFFDKPAILQVLFSFRKGWFIYTPIMLLIIPGAIICYKKNKALFWVITVYFAVNLYIISSWWCWWYGGSFGMRSMIDCYGILSIFMAYTIAYIIKKNKWMIGSVFLVLGFLVYVNLYQTRQARICRIHFDSMTFAAYKQVFLRENLHISAEEWEAMLDTPDYESALKGKRFW